jgi:hypothetical protein
MFIAEFAIGTGGLEAAQRAVRTQQVGVLAQQDPDLEECAWFASEDGLRLFEFASFATNDGALRHLELALGRERPQGVALVGKLEELKVAGPQLPAGRELARNPDARFREICRHEQPVHRPFGQNVFYVLELACEPRHADAVERMIADDFTSRVAHADPEIEEYVWFANETRNRFLQFASYQTSAGVFRHYETSNGTERVARLFEICQLENARIFGKLSVDARTVYSAPIWSHFTEFARLGPRTSVR